jgi:hypothetical protein
VAEVLNTVLNAGWFLLKVVVFVYLIITNPLFWLLLETEGVINSRWRDYSWLKESLSTYIPPTERAFRGRTRIVVGGTTMLLYVATSLLCGCKFFKV